MSSVLQQAQAQQQQQHQQHQSQQNNLNQFQGHSLGNGNVGMESQLSHSQQQQQQQHPPSNINNSMLPPHHSISSNACSVMQQQILENHHQSVMQQVNIPHQHAAHQVPHPAAHSHHHHLNSHTSQQYMPFGMSLNGNNMGNGSSYGGGHPMNTFHPHNHGHQMPDQQPAHAMNMSVNGLHPNCFMQTCLHFQSNPPPLQQAVNAQRVSAAIGWMSGPSIAPHHNAALAHGSTNHNNGGNMNSCIPSQNIAPKASSSRVLTPALPDPTALPGGIEILWRELPPDCQKIMVPQDIPDSARCRGYFTVCELLVLKRGLESRFMGTVKTLANSTSQKLQLNKVVQGRAGKGEGLNKRGPKRGTGKDRSNNKGYRSTEMNSSGKDVNNREARDGAEMDLSTNNMNATEMMQEDADGDNSLYGELMINLGDMKNEIHTTETPAVTGVGVGGAVKEAMDALSSTVNVDQNQNGNGVGNSNNRIEQDKEDSCMKMLMRKDSDSDELVINESPINNVTALLAPGETQDNNDSNNGNGANEMMQERTTMSNELAIVPQLQTMPVFSGLFTEKPNTGENALASASTSSDLSTSSCAPVSVNEESKEVKGSEINDGQQKQEVAVTSDANDTHVSDLSTNTSVQVSTTVGSGGGYSVSLGRYTGTPPPSRTQTLVLKLLQIGAYHIRSFSSVNPNRLRVLFNTQRMTYECQLPVVPPEKLAPGSHPVRRVLTIDIGFEQISMLRFGDDSLWMRVEGAPLLTVAFNAAQDEEGNQVLSPHDQFVLDGIEKGQLKLSPIHHLHFLNERLVHTLQSQFREHPRFRHLLTEMVNF